MINREISYERSVNRSYMKIPAVLEENLDEKLMLKRELQGILPVEKCYVNGMGQYWYNISGKQALDAYCRVNAVRQELFERLILRFCEQVERLEWNLIDINCMELDPELIFVNHSGEEILFTVYPQNKGDLYQELQQLLEFLLTKLDHEDVEVVKEAYALYEMILSEGFSVRDLKESILKVRAERVEMENDVMVPPVQEGEMELLLNQAVCEEQTYGKTVEDCVSKALHFVDVKMERLYERVGKILEKTPLELGKDIFLKKEPVIEIEFVEEGEEEVLQDKDDSSGDCKTVCISAGARLQQGRLICDCPGEYADVQLEPGVSLVGKNARAEIRIMRDTISQLHARIEYKAGRYYIEDLNSTNGTYINEQSVMYKERLVLTPGDQVRFADVSYHFY